MSIKSRLKFSYIAMLLIPFILIIFISNIFVSYTTESSKYNLSGNTAINSAAIFGKIISSNTKLQKKINNQLLDNPDKFLDKEYLIQLEKSIDFNYSGIIVRKNDEIIYSSDYISDFVADFSLPLFKSDIVNKGNKSIHILSQQDFYFKDGSQGSLFYVINMADFKDMIARNAIIVVLSALIILILTNGILTYLTSKSIITPLKELENAANKIKQGNLDYTINISSKDEIGEVGNSFEEMRLQLKESLELQNQYEENRKELISSISHDLKTPITSIKGYIEGIRDGVADTPEKMNKYITTIYTKATYMDSLINDLFLFSKLDLGREAFNFQVVDIRNYINDCVEEINFDLDHSLINLTSKVPVTPILVNIDVHQIKRTIMNIVGNSIKYKSNEKLLIAIIVTENSDYALIEIRDNGKGIDTEALPYIFDRFYREDSSRETSIGGSGLGLAIAKKIIEEHDGSIWAESTLYKGTSIFFSLKKYRQ